MKNRRIIKDALILFTITVVSGLMLGGVHEITKDIIERAAIAANAEANQAVFPEAADFKPDDKLTEAVGSSNAELPSEDYGNVGIDQAFAAVDESGGLLGYTIICYSNDSYSGTVKLLVGINADKSLKAIEVLEINDTPGLGQLAKEPAFTEQFAGKSAEALTVTKSGNGGDAEINAISGATITSRAVTNAVNAALYLVYHHMEQ
ncbi:FMN-binding protein [Lacrimispora sp.]|uniref:FMN-binding protein n=1 Tax=Lacrimispora sp. TaxID=2719234 RepID=UPI003993CF4A